MVALARSYLAQSRRLRAELALERALEQEPEYFDALQLYVQVVQMGLGRETAEGVRKSLERSGRMVSLRPSAARARTWHGRLLHDAARYDDAIYHLRVGAALGDFAEAGRYLAYALAQSGRFEEGLEVLSDFAAQVEDAEKQAEVEKLVRTWRAAVEQAHGQERASGDR